jgi:hypothetical protein
MTDLTHLVGAVVISGFLALNVLAMYLYLRRRIALDPRSASNHAIAHRFDSVDELREFHAQEHAAVGARANAALGRYQRAMASELAAMDPMQATKFPQPARRFENLV